jgi:peptidoglycan biosynthesis protein MviN/MurJ (putative lipid II flippase)
MFCGSCGELKYNYLLDEEFKKKLESKKKFVKEKNKRLGKKLSDSIKDWLLYVGFASAVISIMSYIAITVVMIRGFESDLELKNHFLFSLIGVGFGLVIMFTLRIQGIAFAKSEPESKTVMTTYYKAKNKHKKVKDLKDINHYLVVATIIDVLVKGSILIITTTFVMQIFKMGNGDKSLYGLMLSNILTFTGFGLMAIAKSYDHYIEQHIPVIEERTRKLNNPVVGVKWEDVKAKLGMENKPLPFAELDKDYSKGEVE